MIEVATLVGMQRSAAMLSNGQTVPVEGKVLYAMCSELLEQRQLLERLGTDLRSVARRAPHPP